jgi:hypothetical protein
MIFMHYFVSYIIIELSNAIWFWFIFKMLSESIYLSIYLWLYSPCGPWELFQFLNLYTVGWTPWMGDQPTSKPLPARRTTQTQNKRTQTPMLQVEFEPTIPVFERGETVHALDFAATVICCQMDLCSLNKFSVYMKQNIVIVYLVARRRVFLYFSCTSTPFEGLRGNVSLRNA